MHASWFGVVGRDHRVTSIERTAYPQFRRLVSARVLHVFFTPSADEVAWARERTETPEALLALLVDLKWACDEDGCKILNGRAGWLQDGRSKP